MHKYHLRRSPQIPFLRDFSTTPITIYGYLTPILSP